MGPTLRALGAAALLAVTLSGCETKVTQITVVCRPGYQPTEPVRWFYTSKVDPSVIKQIPVSIDISLHYTGSDPRAVPPITTYFYRQNGATLRVASSATATMPPNGTFTYHVDPGGYVHALTTTGRGEADENGVGSLHGVSLLIAAVLVEKHGQLALPAAGGGVNTLRDWLRRPGGSAHKREDKEIEALATGS